MVRPLARTWRAASPVIRSGTVSAATPPREAAGSTLTAPGSTRKPSAGRTLPCARRVTGRPSRVTEPDPARFISDSCSHHAPFSTFYPQLRPEHGGVMRVALRTPIAGKLGEDFDRIVDRLLTPRLYTEPLLPPFPFETAGAEWMPVMDVIE